MIHANVIEKYGQLIAGTTYKNFNGNNFNLSFNHGNRSTIQNNRKALFSTISYPLTSGLFLQQVHGNEIAMVTLNEKKPDQVDKERTIQGKDAVITKTEGVVLCIQTADCLPIFIFEPTKKIIALIHAGWRGTEQKIVIKVIQTLSNQFNIKPDKLIFSFGPGIHSCCYEVSEQFQNHFSSQVIVQNGQKFFLDLIKENSLQAIKMGVKKKHILTDSSLCTGCHVNQFYSYRKEGKASGRMVSFLALNSEDTIPFDNESIPK